MSFVLIIYFTVAIASLFFALPVPQREREREREGERESRKPTNENTKRELSSSDTVICYQYAAIFSCVFLMGLVV